MDELEQKITAFFDAYAARFNAALADPPQDDVEGTVAAFAPYFMEASPHGVICRQNDDEFRAVIPQGNAFYRSIGTQSMQVARLDLTRLDDLHALARVHWDSRYQKPGGQPVQIEFDVLYLLQVLNGTPKVFAYIVGDEQQALREHGLLPDQAA